MASALNLISDWTGDGGDRHVLFGQTKGLVLRWLNQAQLRFADRSEVLQGVWEPTIPSTGHIVLPADFIREVPNRVKWTSTKLLEKADFSTARALTLSTAQCYSIFDNTFYVFAPSSGTPSIPYIRKPEEITTATLATADLEIPTEYHNDLIVFFDAMYARRTNDIRGYLALMKTFDDKAESVGLGVKIRNSAPLKTKGGMF